MEKKVSVKYFCKKSLNSIIQKAAEYLICKKNLLFFLLKLEDMGKIELFLLTENIFTDFKNFFLLNILYFAIFRNEYQNLDVFSLLWQAFL